MFARLAHLVLAASLLSPALAHAEQVAPPPHAEPAVAPVMLRDFDAPTRAEVRAALAARRAHNVAAFHAYRTRGVYPHNTVRPGPLNVWRDPDGHLCAAATMIDADGQHALVDETAKTQNQIRLLDVTQGPLMSWILTSGLTLEEIDRIQEPMFMERQAKVRAEIERQQARADAKLRADYAATEQYLAKHAAAGLDAATDRLMAEPALAAALVHPPAT